MINFDFDNKRGKLIHYLKDFSDEETRDFFINKINDGVAKLNIDLNNKIYKKLWLSFAKYHILNRIILAILIINFDNERK